MTIPKRLVITVVVMVLASLLAGYLWRGLFNANLPGYLSGFVGGLAALGVWELLRSIKRRDGSRE